MSKTENFPTGTKLKVGDKLGHLIIINITRGNQDLTAECDCKDKDRNQITIRKWALKNKPNLYCDSVDCKYSPANWITINDIEYCLMPGSIIGSLEIGERVYHKKPFYNLEVRCIGSCNSPWFEISKANLSIRLYFDCCDSNCSSQDNRLENESLYSKWSNTKQRLFNENNENFDSYDELIIGLKMEPEWVDNFSAYEAYVETLSPTKKEIQLANPGKRITVDRKDNDYGYIKGNLRWATPEIQRQNQRNSIGSIIVINIRIDYEINNLNSRQLEAKYNILQPVLWNIVNYKTWKNISIQKYLDEYNASKTICGLTLAEIEAQGGLTVSNINKT